VGRDGARLRPAGVDGCRLVGPGERDRWRAERGARGRCASSGGVGGREPDVVECVREMEGTDVVGDEGGDGKSAASGDSARLPAPKRDSESIRRRGCGDGDGG